VLEALLKLLALDFTSPTIMIEEDGDICLEWSEAKDRVLSVSINTSGKMSHAALISGESLHGVTDDAGVINDVLLKLYP
jgi:hypothetical protein